MTTFRLRLFLILTVAACLLAEIPAVAGPYQPPGIAPANYTLIPEPSICEERIQRLERTLEKIAKKVGVEVEPRIVTLQSTRLITLADGVTVLDEPCLPDSSTAVLDIIKRSEPAERAAAPELETLEKRRIELLGQMLKAFDELRSTESKIERIKQPNSTLE